MRRPNPDTLFAPARFSRAVRAQSRLASLAEAVVNTALGVAIAFVAQSAIIWAYHIQLSAQDNLTIVLWMTGVSVVRSYVVRRVWNSEFWRRWLP